MLVNFTRSLEPLKVTKAEFNSNVMSFHSQANFLTYSNVTSFIKSFNKHIDSVVSLQNRDAIEMAKEKEEKERVQKER